MEGILEMSFVLVGLLMVKFAESAVVDN